MKNDPDYIRQLLDKFYEAETSEQEELILKEYFRGEVEPEFLSSKPLFEFYKTGYDDGKPLSDDFDKKFFSNVSKNDMSKKKKNILQYYWYSGIAATFLIAVGAYLFSGPREISENEYNNTVEALILVSQKMELASADLKKLGAIESSFNQFDAFKMLENYGKNINNK